MGTSGGAPDNPPPTFMQAASLSLPLLVLPGTSTYTVTWPGAMPITAYNTFIEQETLLGIASATISGRQPTNVTVKVVNTGLVALGTTIIVVGWV